MTSEAQNTANRANAQSSTGPRTTEGKARVARNSVTLGLFAARDLVHPEEQPEYDELRDALEAELFPATVMERTLAMEILHATWRLRRCSLTEAALNPDDAEAMAAAQASIDRARANARNCLHRATTGLSPFQTERCLRAQLAPDVPETLAIHQAIAKTSPMRPAVVSTNANSTTSITSKPSSPPPHSSREMRPTRPTRRRNPIRRTSRASCKTNPISLFRRRPTVTGMTAN